MSDNFLISVSTNNNNNSNIHFSNGAIANSKVIANNLTTAHINNNNSNFINNNHNNTNFDNTLSPPSSVDSKKSSPTNPFGRHETIPKEFEKYDLDLHNKKSSPRSLDLQSSNGLDLSKFKSNSTRYKNNDDKIVTSLGAKSHHQIYPNPFFNSLTSNFHQHSDSNTKSGSFNGLTLNLSSNNSSKLSPSSLSSSLSSTSSSPMPLLANGNSNNNNNNNSNILSRSNSVTGSELGDTSQIQYRLQQLSSGSSLYNRMDSVTSNGYSASSSPDDSMDPGSTPNGDFLHQNYNGSKSNTHDNNSSAGGKNGSSSAKSPSDFLNNNTTQDSNNETTPSNNNNNNNDNNATSSSSPSTTAATSSSSSSSSVPSSTAISSGVGNTTTTVPNSSNSSKTPTSSTSSSTTKPSDSAASTTSSSSSSLLSSSLSSSSHIAAKLMESSNYPKIPDAYSKILEEYGKASIGKFHDDIKMTPESFYDSFDSFPDSYSKQIEALANGYKSSKSPSSASGPKSVESILSPGNFPKSENPLGMSNGGVFPKPEPSLTNGILGKMESIPISSSPSQVLPSILNFSTNHLRGLASSESGLASYLNSFGMGGPSNPPSSSSGNDSGSNRNGSSGGGVSSGGGASDGISRASPNNKLACRFCGKTFSQAGYIKAHERLHTGEKPFACSVCGKRFSDPSNWKKHERVHANTKKGHMDSRDAKVKNFFFKSMSPLITSSSPFQQRLTFRADMTHSGPVVCKICGKLFSSQSSLSTHKRIHSGVRPYRCYSCDKSFTQIGTLRTHERTHTGHKPYICKICGRTFAQSGSYRMHERRHMTDAMQRCHVCYATFTSWPELQRHMASHPQVNQAMMEFDDGSDKMDNGPLGDDSMGGSGHGQEGEPSPRDVMHHGGPPGHPPPLIPESLLLESGDVPPFHAQAPGLYPSPGQLPPFSSILPFRPHPGVPPGFPPSFPGGLGLLANQGMPVTSHAELMSKHGFFGALNMALGHQPPHLHLQDHHHHHHHQQQQLQQQQKHSSRMASSSSSSASSATAAASSQAQQHQQQPPHHHHHHQQQQQQQQQQPKKSPQQKESPYSDGPEVVSTTSPRKSDLDFRSPNGGRQRYSPEFDKMDREKEGGVGMSGDRRGGRDGGMGGGVVFPRRYSYPEMRNMSSGDAMMGQRREEEMIDEEDEERDGVIYGGIKRGGGVYRKGGMRDESEHVGIGLVKRVRSLEEGGYSDRGRMDEEGEGGIKRRKIMSSVDDNNDDEDSNNARNDYYDDDDDDGDYRRKSVRDDDVRNQGDVSVGSLNNNSSSSRTCGSRSTIMNRFKSRGGLESGLDVSDNSDGFYNANGSNKNNDSSNRDNDNNNNNNNDDNTTNPDEDDDNDTIIDNDNDNGSDTNIGDKNDVGLLPPAATATPTRRHIEKQNLNTRMLSSSSSTTTSSSSSSSSGRKQKHPMRRYSTSGNDPHHHHQQHHNNQQYHHQQLDSPQSTSLPFSSITSTTDLLMEDREDKERQSADGMMDGGVEAEDRQMMEFLLKQGRVHKCQHCRIIFEDASLFLLHNGFHANLDPFECVVCHHVCKDRVEFNCHLTTHIK